jgi:hypothetical protein
LISVLYLKIKKKTVLLLLFRKFTLLLNILFFYTFKHFYNYMKKPPAHDKQYYSGKCGNFYIAPTQQQFL